MQACIEKFLPSCCPWIWAPNVSSSSSLFPSCLFLRWFPRGAPPWTVPILRPYRDLRWRCVHRVLFCIFCIENRVFQQSVGASEGISAVCQGSEAYVRSICWICWIRLVLRRSDTSLRVRATQIRTEMSSFASFNNVQNVSDARTQLCIINQWDHHFARFWYILHTFFHRHWDHWGLHHHIDGETRPEITDNDGKPYLCTDKAWSNDINSQGFGIFRILGIDIIITVITITIIIIIIIIMNKNPWAGNPGRPI